MKALERVRLVDPDTVERRFEQIIGASPALEAVLQQVECVAPTDSTVLIQGETGTGKELIARAVHNLSRRCGRPFIKLNCAAIPFDLLESELFGHTRGAFTGAIAQRTGRFELADKGTLFLDEVGDMPLGLQPKLLRVLQEREIERLGSTQTRSVDVRLVAATNQDIVSLVERNQFREDLYYRLHVFPIQLPPLRERPEDIPLLVRRFVEHFSQRMNKTIETVPPETMEAFTRYNWPGNIRELQNLIERAVILSPGPVLQISLRDLGIRTIAAHGVPKHLTVERARTHAYSGNPERERLGPLRTRWGSEAPGAQPLDSAVPDEETRNHPALAFDIAARPTAAGAIRPAQCQLVTNAVGDLDVRDESTPQVMLTLRKQSCQ